MLLYTMLQGTVPFKANSLQNLHTLILKGNFKYPVSISNEAWHIIESILVVEPTKRMSIPEILQSKWVRSAD